MSMLSSFTKKEKDAVGLLQMGTFLEYFDFMLYVHMSVLLNEIFFPKTDLHVSKLLSSFAFCSTFIFRPFGALLIGYIGDNIGRKATVIITTFMMAISCSVMAMLPTYAEIGIAAAWMLTVCRVVQGMSSMGEKTGAEIYLTELIKLPQRYPVVALVEVCSTLGVTCALGVAFLVTSYGFNWRLAFWIGAGIALIGSIARTALRETPDFIDAKRRMQQTIQETGSSADNYKKNPIFNEPLNKKTAILYFLIQSAQPVWFYFVYIHCGNILKYNFHYSSEQIIKQNFIVATLELVSTIINTYLSSIFHPLKIISIQLKLSSVFFILCPFLLNDINSPNGILAIQAFIVMAAPTAFPAIPVFYKHFPVFKRFTCASLTYATSRALMYVVTSFGLVYLTEYFSHWGLLVIVLPVLFGLSMGIAHFEKLERAAGTCH